MHQSDLDGFGYARGIFGQMFPRSTQESDSARCKRRFQTSSFSSGLRRHTVRRIPWPGVGDGL